MFEEMNQFRCPSCNKLLFLYRLKGTLRIEVRCTRCNRLAILELENMWGSISPLKAINHILDNKD